MLKKLMITTALTGLMIGTATAEGTETPQNPAGTPGSGRVALGAVIR